jgi:thiamine-phosphate pyrophosphorylase
MHRRQPLPRLWMMTDERQGDGLLAALARLPNGAGIVFRHYCLAGSERRRLFLKVRSIARRRRLLLILGGPPRLAAAWGADGSHGPGAHRPSPRLLRSAPVHGLAELKEAERAGADFVFLSPVFPTRSHPGADALGPIRFGLLAGRARLPVIALGGMDPKLAQRLEGFNIYGWAGIDAWGTGSS